MNYYVFVISISLTAVLFTIAFFILILQDIANRTFWDEQHDLKLATIFGIFILWVLLFVTYYYNYEFILKEFNLLLA